MKTKLHVCSLLILLSFACAPFASAGAGAAPAQPNGGILISWNLDFTSNTTADGTSTIAGAFSDEGSRHEDFTVSVNSAGTVATVTGTIVIHGTQGDLMEQFTGEIPLGPNPTLIEGSGTFTGGTGVYAGATGHATFEGTVNFATGKLVGITEGKVKFRH